MNASPARQARLAANLELPVAAKRARVSADYLRDCEARQDFPLVLASRLAAVYGCGLSSFLPTSGRETNRPGASRGGRGRRTPGSRSGSVETTSARPRR